jgi:phosphoglycolate phosphatase
MKAFIFDLDGTITDSSEGIFNSFNYALKKVGMENITKEDTLKYIGPPLFESFSKHLNTDDSIIVNKAVEYFREDYRSKGYKANKLFCGIYEVLETLSKQYLLFIATTKKKDMAERVISMLDIDMFFKEIYGGASKISKAEMLQMIMNKYNLKNNQCIMIGDTHFDFEGAKKHKIYSIGVKWGFGTDEELLLADKVAEKPDDILKIIENF